MDFFVRCKKLSLLNNYYFYVDVKSYAADAWFVRSFIKLRFFKEYHKKDSPYVIHYVRVPKKYSKDFEKACNSLPSFMLLKGYREYVDTAKDILSLLRKEDTT